MASQTYKANYFLFGIFPYEKKIILNMTLHTVLKLTF